VILFYKNISIIKYGISNWEMPEKRVAKINFRVGHRSRNALSTLQAEFAV
jgi:hypothetical protein